MSPVLKIFVGALMMVLGIFTAITYSNQLISLILGGIGPLLVLVGAFVVWLESDEWKMQKKEKTQEKPGNNIQGQQTLQTTNQDMQRETREAAREIKQAVSQSTNKNKEKELVQNSTVNEVKEAVSSRDDLDIAKILQAEKENQNRKTLVNYLERRQD